jgi:TonB family protein
MNHALRPNRLAAAALAAAVALSAAPRAAAADTVHAAEWEVARGLVRAVLPAAPASADEGTVVVRVEIAEDGAVAYAKAQDGPGPLRKEVEQAVREWRFTPFRRGEKAVRVDVDLGVVYHAAERLYFVQTGTGAAYGPPGATLVFENGTLAKDPPAGVGTHDFKADGEAPALDAEEAKPRPGRVVAGKVKRRVQPAYPATARASGVEGVVVVEVIVSKAGYVISARPHKGPSLLRIAAVGAARRWTFTPTTLDDKPVVVIGTVTFGFRAAR